MPENYTRILQRSNTSIQLRNGLICGSYKIKTVCYGTENITYLGPKIWLIIPDQIRGSASKNKVMETR